MKACELGDLDKVADGSRESLRGGAGRILADLAGNIGFSLFLRKLCKPMLLGILSGLGCVWELRDIWAKSQPSSFTPFSLRAHWVDAGADGIPRKQGPAGLCRGELRGLCSPPLELLWSVRLPGKETAAVALPPPQPVWGQLGRLEPSLGLHGTEGTAGFRSCPRLAIVDFLPT